MGPLVHTESYVTWGANTTRNSLVRVPYRPISRLERTAFPNGAVTLILPAPSGQAIMVRYSRPQEGGSSEVDQNLWSGDSVCEVLDRSDLTSRATFDCDLGALTATDDGFFLGTRKFDFDAKPIGGLADDYSSSVMWYGEDSWIGIGKHWRYSRGPPGRGAYHHSLESVSASSGELEARLDLARPTTADVAVITPDGRAVTAYDDWVYPGRPVLADYGATSVEAVTFVAGYSLSPSSVVRFGEQVLSARIPRCEVGSLSAVESWYVFQCLHRWAQLTTVVALNHEGREDWRTDVEVHASQAAIDGTDGRVYIVGNGVVALDGGIPTWSHSVTPWESRGRYPGGALATSFDDGTLAVATGDTLRILGRDGIVLVDLLVPDGARIISPPAIAGDGSIWFATENAIYQAH